MPQGRAQQKREPGVWAGDDVMTEPDEGPPRRTADLLAELARQDLDRLSVEELDARIAALEAEIARTRARREAAARFRAAAEGLFRPR